MTVTAASAQDLSSSSPSGLYEAQFLIGMIDHHAIAVQMGNLCPSRASHSDLQALCSNIVNSQTSEIQQMQGWLQQWYQITHTPQMVEHDQSDLNTLASLKGDDFDKRFMEQMSPHHMVAVQEAAECLIRSAHSDLTSMCNNISSSQASQIQQMRGWLNAWYGIGTLHFMRSAIVGVPSPAPSASGQ
jgi:uncharacterized protein (DUF305 family)